MSAEVLRPGPLAGGGSKLGELIGKLHEYLATTTEDKNESSLPGHWNGETAKDYLEQQVKVQAAEEASGSAGLLSSGRSRRKPTVVTKHSGMNESDASSESGAEDVVSVQSSEPDTSSLPKGTVFVLPEPVGNESRDDFRGPEFRTRRVYKHHKDITDRRRGYEMERVNCTACGQQVNHFQRDSVYRHPMLKVLICKTCFKYYMSDDISKDSEGMDEQCRWCAEGGSLIGCDYCSNAFCKKCVLRNMGRKELSSIMEEERKWYCYVCSPEPLVELVLACDSVMENLELAQKRASRPETSSVRGRTKGCRGAAYLLGAGGGPVPSSGLYQRMQRFVDVTSSLSHSFSAIVQSEREEELKEEKEERMGQLRMFRSVLDDLQAANIALQEALDHELTGSKRAGRVALESQKPKGRARRKKASQSCGLTKELVVKLTPVPVTTPAISSTSPSISPSPDGQKIESIKKCGELQERGEDVEMKVVEMEMDEMIEREEEVESFYVNNDTDEEQGKEDGQIDTKSLSVAEENKRSPRVKTTPRRRRATTSSAAEHADLAEDDSDSDEVPEVLLQTAAAMANSEEEGLVGSSWEGDEVNQQVRKQRLFGLVKTTPPDRSSRKRNLKERSSSSSSSSSASSRRGSQDQGSMVKMAMARAHKVARMTGQSESSSSEVGGQELDSSDSDDQRIKPLTEGVTLLGSGNFQQSSGDEMDIQPGPSISVDDDDLENRIARQILLAQIRGDLSSASELDTSSDEQSENTRGEKKSKRGTPETTAEEDNDGSESSGSQTESRHRHRLLRHGLSLSEAETKYPKQGEKTTKKKQREREIQDLGCVILSSDESSSLDLSEELSQSETEETGSQSPSCKKLLQSPSHSPNGSTNADNVISPNTEERLKSTPHGRRQIRRLLEVGQLARETQSALREEEERRKRLAQREKQRLERERKEREDADSEVIIVAERPAQNFTPLILEQDDVKSKPLVQVHMHFLSKLKPHQREGVQFMWDCCCESVQSVKSSPGSGCILAHCMGLGKTLQVIVFLHTVLLCKLLPVNRALVVCPLNTVLNWKSEFDQWQRGLRPHTLRVTELATVKSVSVRVELLNDWFKKGGVMIMGYEVFRILTHGHSAKNSKHREAFRSMLLNPGPDLVVCDEGHILKNAESSISKAMQALRTRRRIILTGTPLQNNLTEYHCMVDFIKENLLGSLKEFRNRFINPIQNGQCADSTPADVRLMKNRSHVLHELLSGFIQRRDYSVLTSCLPPKREYVLSVRMTPLQCQLYTHYLQYCTGKGVGVGSLFQDVHVLSLIWTHPWCLKLAQLSKNKGKEDSAPILTALGAGLVTHSTQLNGSERGEAKSTGDSLDAKNKTGDWKGREERDGFSVGNGSAADWYLPFITAADAKVLEHSGKLQLVMEILHHAEELQDKVLVFSQSLISLDLIESFLEYADKTKGKEECPYKGKKSWVKNKDYYRLDGNTSACARKRWVQEFNNTKNTKGRLFLISTRAGSLGINLVAANRVVVFDACWNPSYDIQSIFRVYRFGQNKPVSVYRFLAQGTMEQKIYERQVAKQSLSSRVLDQQQIQRHFTHSQLYELYRFQPELRPSKHTETPGDEVLALLLKSCGQLIVSYHEHDSLLDHREEEELSEEERRAAWDEYRAEKDDKPQRANQIQMASVQNSSEPHPMLLSRNTNQELELQQYTRLVMASQKLTYTTKNGPPTSMPVKQGSASPSFAQGSSKSTFQLPVKQGNTPPSVTRGSSNITFWLPVKQGNTPPSATQGSSNITFMLQQPETVFCHSKTNT
ncbi:transcriptional regulator ATRX-like isoform X2 [Myxocyprinus asiaticus]|uniref:transcriptional regulator ATRX-like isoform X2 n=1 Tax=Myxocyprinus asiaticus TaxID=70543 RepID=UPI002222C0CF|nr:transcriptional regulator ATRX-like isoform X2 [Myxocyprinus asiaticus]